MNYNLQIQKLLLEAEKRTSVEDKIVLLKQAIAIADVNNDVGWGIDLRLDILQHEVDTPSSKESFPAFVWVLNAYDNDPDIIDECDFLWAYKWMADEAISSSDISLEQVDDILDDFRIRLTRNGYSDRAYYNLLVFKYMFLGEFDKVHDILKLRDKALADGMSDSKAWEHNVRVLLALKEGCFDDAVFFSQDIISKKLTSEGLPFATLSSMVYYLAKGRDKRAAEYLSLVEREVSMDNIYTAFVCNLAQVAFACYAVGDKDKTWHYFEKTAHWEQKACDFLKFDYIVFMLPMLREGGERKLDLNHKLPYYKQSGSYNIVDIYNYYYPIANDLAKRFDERNKNTVFSDRLKELVAFEF